MMARMLQPGCMRAVCAIWPVTLATRHGAAEFLSITKPSLASGGPLSVTVTSPVAVPPPAGCIPSPPAVGEGAAPNPAPVPKADGWPKAGAAAAPPKRDPPGCCCCCCPVLCPPKLKLKLITFTPPRRDSPQEACHRSGDAPPFGLWLLGPSNLTEGLGAC
eukprot:COSAG01_NODE_535_length_15804_cov_33.841452_10_plen_161_part_00